jgi:hypothetical protein
VIKDQVGIIPERSWRETPELIVVGMHRNTEAAQVVLALSKSGRLACGKHGRQIDPKKDSNDCAHYEKLDAAQPTACAVP